MSDSTSNASALVEITGVVGTAYQPGKKTGYKKFFFVVRDKEDVEHKGMAPAEYLREIRCGNVVEVAGEVKRGWLTPQEVHVWREPDLEIVRETVEIGHVGQPRATHYGWGCAARLGESWLTIPCEALTAYFNGGREDIRYGFPRRGRGTMIAQVFRQGHDYVVVEIEDWQPMTKVIEGSVAFSDVFWGADQIGFSANGSYVVMPTADLPFEMTDGILKKMPAMRGVLTYEGTAVAHSDGPHRINWVWQTVTLTVEGSIIQQVEHMIESDKVARSIVEVRKHLRDLWSEGVVVDLTMVQELFLAKGVIATREQVEESWARRGYDTRFMTALETLAGSTGRIWAASEGFLILVKDWLVWEVPTNGHATYILPAQPNDALAGESLSLDEWVGVLGRILPDMPKMDLRYNEVGQALAGCMEGVQFAFHVTDDDGKFGGWLDAVKAATASGPSYTTDQLGLPSLDDILALTAGEEE